MSRFEPSQLKAWLRECETQHDDCKENESSPVSEVVFHEETTSNFRLLDVERGCIVPASFSERYIALSHAIPQTASSLKLIKYNYETLTTDEAFHSEDVVSRLPAAVKDAINLIHALGERYLWVHVLCVVQDSSNDRTVSVSLQHAIFRNAYLTVVAAACTAGAESCLAPFPEDDEVSEKGTGSLPNITLALSESPYSMLAETLAQLASAQRAIIFTDQGVFYCCHQGTCHQGTYIASDDNPPTFSLLPGPSPINKIPSSLDGLLPHLTSYIQLSQQYTQKTVDCDGDALRSFYGISRPLFAGMRTIGVEGLPGYYINAFLLFKLPTGDARRWPEFGSFSWAGWQGGIEWLFHELGGSARDVVHWLKYDSLVEWDELTPSGQLQDLVQMEEDGSKQSNLVLFLQEHQHIFPGGAELLSKASQHDQFKSYITGTTGRLDMVSWGRDILDVPEGAFPEIERFPLWAFDLVSSRIELDRLLRQNGLQGYDLAMRGWSTSRRYRLKILAEAQKGTDSPFKRAIPAPNTPRYRQPRLAKDSDEEKARLASDKRAANARKHDPEADIPDFPPYSVLYGWAVYLRLILGESDKQGEISTVSLISSSGSTVGYIYPDNTTLLPPPGSEIDLVVLGLSNSAGQDSKEASAPSSRERTFYLWVMCVEWYEGIAQRRGIGRIEITALENAVSPGPTVKRVLLG